MTKIKIRSENINEEPTWKQINILDKINLFLSVLKLNVNFSKITIQYQSVDVDETGVDKKESGKRKMKRNVSISSGR